MRRTVTEAVAAWLTADGERAIGGLYGGRLVPRQDLSFSLVAYSDVPGLAITGKIKLDGSLAAFFDASSPAIEPEGSVSVTGPRAAHGVVTIEGASVHVVWKTKGGVAR